MFGSVPLPEVKIEGLSAPASAAPALWYIPTMEELLRG